MNIHTYRQLAPRACPARWLAFADAGHVTVHFTDLSQPGIAASLQFDRPDELRAFAAELQRLATDFPPTGDSA